jgi:hypothetical protein
MCPSYTLISNLSISDFPIYAVAGMEHPPLWIEPEHYKIVGACLAAARRNANITQQELAARLGKPQSFISEYERGARRVDVVELLVIARELGADPLDLFAKMMRSA